MAAPTVYQDVAEEFGLEGVGQLFAGKKFWVAQRVPSRNRLLDEIKANGGEIVVLEKKADYRIADHFRKDCPPGSISYEFVDKSIQEGRIRDPEDHRAGPPLGEAREPGAINRPAKGSRAYYTAEEDRILYNWVSDCEANGGQASGNEIYKQLEAKHPRHTWQSWRDRYLKQLRTRSPSAFSIPDNAQPSPPSATLPEQRRPPVPASSKQQSQTAPRQEQPHAAAKMSGQGRVRDAPQNTTPDYSLEQLAATFDSDDWEELYAFVDIIDAIKGQDRYNDAWKQWAESQDNQTVDQWRQYYEKVVRPQWLRDPESKREQIRQKIEKKHENKPSPSQSISQQQKHNLEEDNLGAATTASAPNAPKIPIAKVKKPSEAEDERFEEERFKQLVAARRTHNDDAAAYIFYAREKKWTTWNAQPDLDYTQLHKLLMSQWQSLSDASKAPFVAMNQATKTGAQVQATKLSSEVQLMSSSTAQHESPRYIKEMSQNVLKRVHGDNITKGQEEQDELPRPSKRQKSTSPVNDPTAPQGVRVGTQKQPVDIFSSDSSTSTSQPEADDERVQDQIRSEVEQSMDEDRVMVDSDFEDAEKEAQSVESDDFLDIGHLAPLPEESEEASEDDLPSNTPTPRASRQKQNNFDTQAILSSPSQGIGIDKLPRPVGYTQDLETQSEHRSSSLAPHPESEASTTQSLQDFRRSLNDEDATQPSYPSLPPLPPALSLSPTPSSTSSTTSGDPDVPLDASEIDAFFSSLNAEGFSDDFIAKALKRTRCRPELAEIVLEAWRDGKPLPNQRGIWSLADDEAAESGDGVALARLERKHTLDGWGGLTERQRFLEEYRSRG